MIKHDIQNQGIGIELFITFLIISLVSVIIMRTGIAFICKCFCRRNRENKYKRKKKKKKKRKRKNKNKKYETVSRSIISTDDEQNSEYMEDAKEGKPTKRKKKKGNHRSSSISY